MIAVGVDPVVAQAHGVVSTIGEGSDALQCSFK